MRPALISSLLLLACGTTPVQPAEPVWGKQPCEHCLMIVSEPRPAAQAVLADGTRAFFDDVGCLAAWMSKEHLDVKHAWVRSPDGSAWVDARSARYQGGQRTPMDYGFLSDAQGIDFRELVQAVGARDLARRGAP